LNFPGLLFLLVPELAREFPRSRPAGEVIVFVRGRMGQKSVVVGIAILVAIAASIVYLAISVERASSQEICWVCNRPLHERSRTVGLLGNSREVFCCPACALTAHRQTGKLVRILELTDYVKDSTLDPKNTFLVRGSDVNLCSHHHPLVDSAKQTYQVEYDRCSPSVLAFAAEQEAEAFAKEHGGTVLPFRDFEIALEK
jgi:hypothetical protein